MTKLRHTQQNAIAWAMIVRQLLDSPCTALELAEETGLRHETVLGYLRALKRQRAIYVAAWNTDTNGRRTVAAYRLGNNRTDAPRDPVPRKVIRARYRVNARQRAIHNAIQGIPCAPCLT